jgi:transposase InsO family protein
MSRRGDCYDNAVMESFFSGQKRTLWIHSLIPLGICTILRSKEYIRSYIEGVMLLQHLLEKEGDFRKFDRPVEEGTHCHFISGIENGGCGLSLLNGLIRQFEALKSLWIGAEKVRASFLERSRHGRLRLSRSGKERA